MKRATAFCFLLISVTYTIGWTTISSELAYFKQVFGPQILLQLNLAYFLPSIPILLLQTYWDEHFDLKFGAGAATCFRFAFGFGGVLGVSIAFPFLAERALPILSAVSILGLASGVLFGSSYQLVSLFPAQNTVALTLGYVASGPLVLLFNLIFDIGPHPSASQRLLLFIAITAVTASGLIAALYIFYTHWPVLQRHRRADDIEAMPLMNSRPSTPPSESDQAADSERITDVVPLPGAEILQQRLKGVEAGRAVDTLGPVSVATDHSGYVSEQRRDEQPSKGHQQLTGFRLLACVWPAAVSLAVSISTSVLVFPFFTYVPTCGRMTDYLPQRLFAARVTTDILGRLLPRKALLTSTTWLLMFSSLKLAMTPLFFMYIDGTLGFRDDRVAVLYVAVFWWLSGYLNTCAYVMAPQLVPRSVAPKAGATMALLFQVSSLMALLVAQMVQSLHYADYSHQRAG